MHHKDIVKKIKEQTKIKGMVTPCYNGMSLLNVTPSILEHFKTPCPNQSIDKQLLNPKLFSGVKHIILMIIDGLGYHQVLDATNKNKNLGLKKLIEKDTFFPLTSVAPSTTTAALTTVNTALAPGQHAMVGYHLFLKEFGAVSNMLKFKPVHAVEDYRSLGADPRSFFPLPTIYQRLRKKKVFPATLMPSDIADSGLSQMTNVGGEMMGYHTTANMVTEMKKHLVTHKNKKTFTYMYTPHMDTMGHLYGAKSTDHDAQLANIDFSLFHDLLNTKNMKNTMLMITADHGFMQANPKKIINLLGHDTIIDNLVFMPTGESRFTILHVKNGKKEIVKKYCEDHFAKKAVVLESQQALDMGLFGPRPHPQPTKDRLGDLLLLPKEDYLISYKHDRHPLIGRHGGLSETEMLIPLIVKKFN